MSDSASKQARMNSLLNRKRKSEVSEHQPVATVGPSSSTGSDPDAESQKRLTSEDEKRKATEAIIREAKRARERAEKFGPQGWLRPKSLNTNKQFLHRTLAATLPERKPKRQKSSRSQSE